MRVAGGPGGRPLANQLATCTACRPVRPLLELPHPAVVGEAEQPPIPVLQSDRLAVRDPDPGHGGVALDRTGSAVMVNASSSASQKSMIAW